MSGTGEARQFRFGVQIYIVFRVTCPSIFWKITDNISEVVQDKHSYRQTHV